MNVYSVYDSKAEAFLRPFFEKTRGLAMRAFVDACNRGDHDFALHPGDYTLFDLGVFDDITGLFRTDAVAPVPIMSGMEARAMREKE